MSAQALAALLLTIRVLATISLSFVIAKQIKMIRTTTTDYPWLRVTMLVLTIALLLGQVVPIILDSLVTFGPSYPGRNRTPNLLASSYALSNASKDLILSALLIIIYYRPLRRRR